MSTSACSGPGAAVSMLQVANAGLQIVAGEVEAHCRDYNCIPVESLPYPGRVVYHLRPGDVVEEDATGHVLAVRHATTPPTWTYFDPGATSPSNEEVVYGPEHPRPKHVSFNTRGGTE